MTTQNIVQNSDAECLMSLFAAFVDILPFSVAVCAKDGELLYYNHLFVNLLPFEQGDKLKNSKGDKFLLRDLLYIDMKEAFDSVNCFLNEDITLLPKCNIRMVDYQPTLYRLLGGEYFVYVLRDVCNKQIVAEEVICKVEKIIAANLKATKMVGEILGEASAKEAKQLNSIIRSLR